MSLCVWLSEVNKCTSPFGWFCKRVIIDARRLKWRDTTAQGPGGKPRKEPPQRQNQQNTVITGCRSAAAKSLQSCPTLCDPIDGSPPGSPVPGILQARTLEWVAISLSSAWKWKVKVKSLSRVWLLVTPWTAAYQAPLSTGFSRQEYWGGVPSPSPIRAWGKGKVEPWRGHWGFFLFTHGSGRRVLPSAGDLTGR